tara:strand:- start:15125 stop:16084 length:960 start_codon:yes stop_codon:yes gene_type:complete
LKKFLVIGAGRIALTHIPHLIINPNIELVGIVEKNFLIRFIIKRLTNIPTYRSVGKLSDSSYEGVFILTPPKSHFSLANYFINKRKHVFVEKPLTLDPKQSMDLVKNAKKNNIHLSVGYVYRYHPIFLHLKETLKGESFKKIKSVEISMIGNVVSSETPKTWRNIGVGSGCIYDYGCHVIDLSFFLFGKPNRVENIEKNELFQPGVVDKFSAKLKYEGNFDVNIFCNWSDSSARKAGISIEIHSDRNSIWTDGQIFKINEVDVLTIKDLNTDVSYYLRGEEFQNQLDKFISNIKERKDNNFGADDAAYCDEIIEQLNRV